MNEDKQKIAIAEKCGWLGIEYRDCIITGEKSWLSGLNPNPYKIIKGICAETGDEVVPNESNYGWESLPNYLYDLNAMHEAEKMLKWGSTASRYNAELKIVFFNRGILDQREDEAAKCYEWYATAKQRAEAFLLTFDLWEI